MFPESDTILTGAVGDDIHTEDELEIRRAYEVKRQIVEPMSEERKVHEEINEIPMKSMRINEIPMKSTIHH